jgi:hypothetical protein
VASLSVVLYAVGSPVVVDVEESLMRRHVSVAAAVRNVADQPWTSDVCPLVDQADLDSDLLSRPFLVPLFAPGNRQKAAAEARASGFTDAFTLVDPTSVTPSRWTVAAGTYINGGCAIGALVRFDEFVFVNRGACIGHHTVLHPFVSVGPGVVLGGQVEMGKGAFVGAGAVVLPGLRIGANAVVGAGAVVTRDVPDHTLVAGNPARLVKADIAGYRDLTVT